MAELVRTMPKPIELCKRRLNSIYLEELGDSLGTKGLGYVWDFERLGKGLLG